MTVAELIEKLKEMPGDLPVAYRDEAETWEVASVENVANWWLYSADRPAEKRNYVRIV